MKLKKLLAAVTAAALAVTTMAVTSFTVSAAELTADDWQMTSTADSISYSITSPADSTNNSPSVEKTVDVSSLVNETEESPFRCVTVTATGDGSPYVNSKDFSSGSVKLTDKEALSSIVIGTWWITPGVTQTITFTVEYGEPLTELDRTITQSNTGNVYTAVVTSAAAPEGSIWTDGADSIMVDLTALLPEGFNMADVRKITAVVTSTNEWGNGSIGMNVKETWTSPKPGWSSSSDICEISTPDGLNSDETTLQVQNWSAKGGDTITATITVEDKDGNVYPAAGEEETGEISIAVSPKTKTIAVDEEFDVTVEVTATEGFVGIEGTLTPEYDESVISVTYDKENDVFKVTGLAAGSTDLTIGWEPDEESGITLEDPIADVCKVTVTEESGSDEVDTSGWIVAANGFAADWTGWQSAAGTAGKLDFTCTIKDIMDANSISDIADFGGFSAQAWGVPLGDKVSFAVRIEAADGTVKANDTGTYTVVLTGGDGENKDEPNYTLKQYAVAACGGNFVFAPTDVVKIVVASGTTVPTFPAAPDDGDDDDNTDRIYALLWEGTEAMGNWSGRAEIDITADILSKIKVGDKIVSTIVPADGAQFSLKYKGENWPGLPGFTAANGGNDYTGTITATTYTHIVTAEDIEAMALGLVVSGHDYTLTKVELNPDKKPAVNPPATDPDHTHTPATIWSNDATNHWHACSGCDEKLDNVAHTSDNGTDTTPATETTAGTRTYKCTVCGRVMRTETIPATGSASESVYPSYVGAPVIPVTGVKDSSAPAINGQNGWEAVTAEITAASDGDKLVVDMNSATKVPSTVFKAIKGKDVDLVLNLNSSIKWTINGLSVTSTKAIDFDVTKNTKHIPNEVVDKAEGSHKRQISLDHNGSFGCNAVMSYEVGTQYNGLYANLFYYNRKAKELELIDCSPISGGKANFLFTHASDYLITISDEPLGDYEDVSSAAGIISDNSGVNSIAFCSVLAVITLASGFVIYKKRRHN